MMDLGSVATVLTSLKTAADMAKVVKDINDETKRQSAVIDLQNAIMNAQSNAIEAQAEQLAMLKQIAVLEAKIEAFDSWDSDLPDTNSRTTEAGLLPMGLSPNLPILSQSTSCAPIAFRGERNPFCSFNIVLRTNGTYTGATVAPPMFS
jgi:hypothetical protein